MTAVADDEVIDWLLDGAWTQARRHPGQVWFEVDVGAGEPSKWLTFYAIRVLEWWDVARG